MSIRGEFIHSLCVVYVHIIYFPVSRNGSVLDHYSFISVWFWVDCSLTHRKP